MTITRGLVAAPSAVTAPSTARSPPRTPSRDGCRLNWAMSSALLSVSLWALAAPEPPCGTANPRERTGAEPPQRDFRHDQGRHRAHQPGPDLDGDSRLSPRLQEHVLGVVDRTPAGQLGDLAQEGIVDAEVPKFLGVRHHQAGQL